MFVYAFSLINILGNSANMVERGAHIRILPSILDLKVTT